MKDPQLADNSQAEALVPDIEQEGIANKCGTARQAIHWIVRWIKENLEILLEVFDFTVIFLCFGTINEKRFFGLWPQWYHLHYPLNSLSDWFLPLTEYLKNENYMIRESQT